MRLIQLPVYFSVTSSVLSSVLHLLQFFRDNNLKLQPTSWHSRSTNGLIFFLNILSNFPLRIMGGFQIKCFNWPIKWKGAVTTPTLHHHYPMVRGSLVEGIWTQQSQELVGKTWCNTGDFTYNRKSRWKMLKSQNMRTTPKIFIRKWSSKWWKKCQERCSHHEKLGSLKL